MSGTTTPRHHHDHHDDTPAVALGPLALILGVVAALGTWPTLTLFMLPWSIITGGLAITFGAAGIHYARQGIGRMGTAVAGTTLGAIGLAGVLTLFGAFVV
ncbi:hypothetical protein [Streptomyces olivochromogenes]|uniref:hypothetical protein n=1 Tax=Streptomyces olivochromogenes TaxID=1963 RepID=UPI001F20216D|nr:hypothetical protein [Streptomyces olivochromogenes]MCF3131226.1 hypothetical protein [Streptomyces olivochromogenes]